MGADVDGEVLASCWRGGGCGGGDWRSKDFGAALGCYCEAGGRVEVDGEGDVVAGDEAAAVGKEEKEGDCCGVLGFWGAWVVGSCGCG